MAATLLRLGYGTPVSGAYPFFVDLTYPAWQLKDGGGYLVRNGRRMSKTPVARGTLVQGLGKLAQDHEIDLLYRPRLREFTPRVARPVWDEILVTIEDKLLEQECGFYWGDRLRGRFLVSDYTWLPRDAGYPPDTNTQRGGFFAREVDVHLKLTRLLG